MAIILSEQPVDSLGEFEERAGILQFDAGYSREEAEEEARKQCAVSDIDVGEKESGTFIKEGTTLTALEMATLNLIRECGILVFGTQSTETKKALNRLIRKNLVCFNAKGNVIEKK